MARDDDHSNTDNGFARGIAAGNPGNNQRQEPTFGGFDDDDAYEEPDRDADYTSGYHTDEADREDDLQDNQQEDFDGDFPDNDESDLFRDEDTDAQSDADMSAEDEDEEEPDTWLANGDYPEEGEERGQNWPLSLIAVAVVALMLLAAGGYGVMQQRAATEEELRDLRAKLATASNPRDGTADLVAQGELRRAYDTLAAEAEALRLENKTLTDTVAGLETQLGSQQQAKPTAAAAVDESVVALYTQSQAKPTSAAAVAESPESRDGTVATTSPKPVQAVTTQSPPAAQIAPAPAASQAIAAKPAVAASSGRWFVNFGSYATRDMADSWAVRLQPGAGKVIVMPITSAGRTLYRLRVIGLADGDSARQVARKLETELRVAELWVGKE